MKKAIHLTILFAMCALLCGACVQKPQENEDYHIDLADPSQGIYTAADLIAFFESGESDTAVLGDSVDLDGAMLKLAVRRGALTLNGNGNSITSSADCVIRLEDGAALTLNHTTIIAGADGIGCLGDARLAGEDLTIQALTNAIYCAGNLNILQNSGMSLTGSKGSGIIAQSLYLEKAAEVAAFGEQSAVHVLKNDLQLTENARLSAQTSKYYCALKCAGTLRLENGAELDVKNEGEYHGAELTGLEISGKATIKADGGKHGTGLFLFNLKEDYTVAGHCTPELRLESGRGQLKFVDSVDRIPDEKTTDTGETQAE